MRTIIGITALLALTACGGGKGPSKAEMEAVILNQMQSLTALAGSGTFSIASFKKHECHDAPEGRMRCGYSFTAQITSRGGQKREQKHESTSLFEKRGSGWAIVQ